MRDLWNIHAGVQTNQAREIHEDAGYAAGVRREGRICGARYHLLRYPPRVGNSLPRAVSGLRSGCVHAKGSGVAAQLKRLAYFPLYRVQNLTKYTYHCTPSNITHHEMQ